MVRLASGGETPGAGRYRLRGERGFGLLAISRSAARRAKSMQSESVGLLSVSVKCAEMTRMIRSRSSLRRTV